MNTLRLYFPVKPMTLNQGFGSNPDYYARFKDRFGNPEKGHMGLDFKADHGTPVYAACDGSGYFAKDEHGGEGIYVTTDVYDYKGSQARYNVIYWHLVGDTDPAYPSPVPLDGSRFNVKAGHLIGYADNTGAPFESTGDHLHLGLVPFDLNGNAIEAANGFNGCIDPMPYFTGYYAQDVSSIIHMLSTIVALLTEYVKQLAQRRSAPSASTPQIS